MTQFSAIARQLSSIRPSVSSRYAKNQSHEYLDNFFPFDLIFSESDAPCESPCDVLNYLLPPEPPPVPLWGPAAGTGVSLAGWLDAESAAPPAGSTRMTPIIPPSSCSSMWQ